MSRRSTARAGEPFARGGDDGLGSRWVLRSALRGSLSLDDLENDWGSQEPREPVTLRPAPELPGAG